MYVWLQRGFNFYTTSSAVSSPSLYLEHLQLRLVLPSMYQELTMVLSPQAWDLAQLFQNLLPRDLRRHLPSVQSSPWRLCCSAGLTYSVHADTNRYTLRRWP